jgi:hypothetical protein
MKRSREVEILFDYTRSDACPWLPIDDVVMGGVSHSAMGIENCRAVFAGAVSLDHGGGFASVRSQPGLWDLSEYGGIILTFRGDGRRYKLRMKTDPGFDGVNWETAIVLRARSPVQSPDREIERRGEAYPQPIGYQKRPRERRDPPK